jgi:pimeloyl-ACP methyl ester carboxylesterase
MDQESNVTVTRNNHQERAVVFVHGFSGARDDTWESFPTLLKTATPDWDIYTLGYATTFLPDVLGVWSADPDVPILATMLWTQLNIPPFQPYRSIALIAHSMGGLVVQKALVDDPALAARIRNVILFGTPSAGLRKAGWLQFWKRQLNNMSAGSPFITGLRAEWKRLYMPKAPFNLLAVGGASDQFVPPESSQSPFDRSMCRIVPGNHVSLVKPANADAPSFNLVMAALGTGSAPLIDVGGTQRPPTDTSAPDLTVEEVVEAALALEQSGQRAKSIALLERHKDRDTDIKGTLAGRLKRLWFETGQVEHAQRALELYQQALSAANREGQTSYLAINVAFMKFTYANDAAAARSMAELALQHAAPAGEDVWKAATVAEAHLYLDRIPEALVEYRRVLTLGGEAWKYASVSLQAGRVAAKLGNVELVEDLEEIFTPGAKRVNRLFLSYSQKDRDWAERLKKILAPYLRDAEAELELWDDARLLTGQEWEVEFRHAIAHSGVAVALVSPAYLSSPWVVDGELSEMIKAAREGGLRLLWVHVSAAAWQETPLNQFQAAHAAARPLDELPDAAQNEILQSIAIKMKEAALGATGRFRGLPSNEQEA